MGRSEGDEQPSSQIFYPAMQCADVFFLKADICQLGLDQRKVNMLAREYAAEKKLKDKPIIISHHMMMGLLEGQAKMSKSDPESAIFMEDTVEDVKRKIKKAFCPPKIVEENPILDYLKHIIFNSFSSIEVKRPEKWGGNITYNSYEELEKDWVEGNLNPEDIKPAVTEYLNRLIDPVRQHFQKNAYAKSLLEQIKEWRK